MPNVIAQAGLNSVCTIWDIDKMAVRHQLVAHDGVVNSIRFVGDDNSFITGGGDGSVRIFDMRNPNFFSSLLTPRALNNQLLPIMRVIWEPTQPS